MDKEVLREIWHGQLPLCFKLHDDDVSGMHRPDPYYMMVSRVTYFPLVWDRVVKYFSRFMDQSKQPQSNNNIWLDFDGQPVRLQYPIGMSWDLLGSSCDLPWNLILHFSDFPAKELVRCNTKASIETNFFSNIKEADALKHKGSVIKNLEKKYHNQLWLGLLNDKFDQFWLINNKLMERIQNKLFRYIPFRLYFPDYTYVQKTIEPTEIDTTMLDLIKLCFKNRMHDLIVNYTKMSSTDGEKEDEIDVNMFKYRFISHGTEIPFDTPLQWLSEHLSYPDNFLHICAVIKEKIEYQ